MKERPILFSAPMVRAILEGRKTQTRRIVKLPSWAQECNEDSEFELDGDPPWPHAIARKTGCLAPIDSPYGQPGDQLWVRETWRQAYAATGYSNGIVFKADATKALGMDEYSDRHKWRPSIFMPRSASRVTLEVTGVRVERLQEISEADAREEGCPNPPTFQGVLSNGRDWYRRLWDEINAKRAPWSSNPWVWVIEFRWLP